MRALDLIVQVAHLEQVTMEWAPGQAGNYRDAFVAAPADASLQKILTGIGMLSGDELAQERMYVAYESQDQEDEHSCFSDTTHTDLKVNQAGIRLVYFGDSETSTSHSVHALIESVDPQVSSELGDKIKSVEASLESIPVPFDQALVDALPEGRARILAAVEELEEQTDLIVKAAEALDIRLNLN